LKIWRDWDSEVQVKLFKTKNPPSGGFFLQTNL
jgi:hypothetical protein